MASFFSSAGSFLITVLASVFVFGIVIFIHELGHFLTAKFSGIQVNEFALGMGPTLFSFTRGGTKYGLRLFPIGGFVSMEGEDEESEEAVRLFLEGRIPFLKIGELVEGVVDSEAFGGPYTLDDVYACDAAARAYVLAHVS